MFKELVFELLGRPRGRHARGLFERSVSARLQVIHATPAACWELVNATGEQSQIEDLVKFLEKGPRPPMRDVELVSVAADRVQYVVNWDRPERPDDTGILPFLLHDTVGPEAMFRSVIEHGRMRVRVAGPEGDKLLEYFDAVGRTMGDRSRLRLLRAGELSTDFDAAMPKEPTSLKSDERDLIAIALASGYYDNPKRCGVRELGEAIGCSKSVVARKLRTIERAALEALVSPEGEPASNPAPVTGAPVSPENGSAPSGRPA